MTTRPWLRLSASVSTSIFLLAGPQVLPGGTVDGQWYLEKLQIRRVQQLANGSGVTIAVIDTGVNSMHPALAGSVLAGADFSNNEDLSTGDGRVDINGHGTGMASLIVGHGIVNGIAPSAKILPVRVVAAGDAAILGGSSIAVAAGIRWAVDHGADVINLSIGSPVTDPWERAAVRYALAQGAVVVAAVGNSDEADAVMYPAREEGVVAVASTNKLDEHSALSVSGPEVVVSAPGEGIWRAGLGSKPVLANGTSDSAAIVSGIVALILQTHPGISSTDVWQRLADTADDKGEIGRDELYGFGIVNPYRALTAKSAVLLPSKSSSPKASSGGESDRSARWSVVLVATVMVLLVGMSVIVAVRLVR